MRHDIGGLAALDIYFDEQFTTGMSAAIAVSYPLTSRSVRPVGTGFDWEYSEYDSTGEQKALLQFGFGPVFRFDAGDVEIILPIRFSVASFDCFSSGVLVGVWIDPAVNVFITDRIFFTGGIQYNAHLMKFLFNESRVYEAGYIKLSVGLFAGIGIRMGG